MALTSFLFLLFLFITLVFYYILPKKFRWVWLLLASLAFVAFADIKFVFVLVLATLISYFAGILISKTSERKNKKIFLLSGIILNLCLLFSFKYLNFFIGSFSQVLNFAGITRQYGPIDLFLPLGISFYTFQAISYLVDVNNDVIPAEKNIGQYLLYLSFFPKFISGPIERGGNLLPQLHSQKPFEYQRFLDGLVRIGWGFFKKLVIADRLAIVVNTVFSKPGEFYSPQLIVAILAFSFQVYIDFSAYTDIAIGSARLFGIDLTENFNLPYLATSVTDFWRRWHISLTSWLRDYIFIPLNFAARRKRSSFYKYMNIIIVFLVSGIWHGANWTFIVWGLLHGVYQVIEAATQKVRDQFVKKFNIDRQSFGHKFWQVTFTFFLVSFAWIFFRANSLQDAFLIIGKTFSANAITTNAAWNFMKLGLSAPDGRIALIALAIFAILECSRYKTNMIQDLNRQPLVFRWFVYFILIFAVIFFGFFGTSTPQSFIYAQF
ncbi:MAG: MBOAT family O-acyltransferase [Anaerolineaceae bacterium]|nr:MBOAT family O-acyltransferase [Anaerolineaceae bacterium]